MSEFRDQVARRLSGELNEEEFKPLRLMNGVYLQLHAYMLRVCIPMARSRPRNCGRSPRWPGAMTGAMAISPPARTSSFNWIKLNELPDAMAELAEAAFTASRLRQLHSQHHHDPWAGATPEELEDPRLYAEIIRSGPRSTRNSPISPQVQDRHHRREA